MAFSPDAAGRVQLKTDQNGDSVTFNYVLAGRMFKRDYRLKVNSPSGTIADSDTFTFDRSSRMLTGISGRYANTVTMNYAANDGRLANESLTIAGQTYTVSRTYDARGKLFQMIYPNGAVVERAYTNRGQLNTIKYKDTATGTLNTEDTRTYDLGGRLSTSAYRNGVTTTYAYRSSGSQKDNLLASISFAHPAGVTSNDDKVGTHTYAWDANKNKSSETITGAATAYINFGFTTAGGSDPDGYDDEDRLVYFKRTGTTNPQTWNLSLVGDWNSYSDFGTIQNRTHGPSHEILTAGAAPNNVVLHDVKGNITDIPTNISSPARKLFWDFDNRLNGVDNTGDSIADVTYEFDALGRRVARTQGSTAIVYIPAGQQTIADYTRGTAASTTPLDRYVYGDYIDEPILRQTGSTTLLYYHHNQQYSTIALTTSTGFVTERYAYTAYGVLSILTNAGTARPWTDTSNRYTYTGREWDETTKLFHFRARWYDPLLGRFLGRDPIGSNESINLYENEFNINGIDPSGKNPLAACLIAGGLAAAVTIVYDLIIGDFGWKTTGAKALCSGFTTCIAAAFATLGPWAGCVAGGIAGYFNGLCQRAVCRIAEPIKINACDMLQVAVSMLAGCMGGVRRAEGIDPLQALILILMGTDMSIWASTCLKGRETSLTPTPVGAQVSCKCWRGIYYTWIYTNCGGLASTCVAVQSVKLVFAEKSKLIITGGWT